MLGGIGGLFYNNFQQFGQRDLRDNPSQMIIDQSYLYDESEIKSIGPELIESQIEILNDFHRQRYGGSAYMPFNQLGPQKRLQGYKQ